MNVEITINHSDNPEDHSLENTKIAIGLTTREMARLDELRGGDSVSEYVRRTLDVECLSEEMQEIKDSQDAPFLGQSAA